MLRKNALENPTIVSRQAERPCPLWIPAGLLAQTPFLFQEVGFALPTTAWDTHLKSYWKVKNSFIGIKAQGEHLVHS